MKFSSILLAIYAFCYAFISGMPEYTHIENIVGAILTAVFFIEYFSLKGHKIVWSKYFNLILLFYCIALFSLLFHPEAARRFLSFTFILMLFYAIFCIVKVNGEIIYLVGGLTLGLLATIYFNYEVIMQISNGLIRDRFSGSMNANSFSFLLSITIAFLLRPLYQGEKGRGLSFLRIGVILVFSYLILVVVGSRRGILTLFTIFVWTLFYVIAKQPTIYKLITGVTFVSIGLLLFSMMYNSIFYSRFENLLLMVTGEQVSDNSLSVRTKRFRWGLELWLKKPFWGWGFEGYRFEAGIGGYHSHNNYIQLLANHGLIGFLLYYSFVGSVFSIALKKFKRNNISERGVLSWIMLLITLLLISDLADSSITNKTNWIVLAVAFASVLNVRVNKRY